MLLILAGPWLNSALVKKARSALPSASEIVRLPIAAQAWTGPNEAATEWRPAYSGAVGEGVASYSRSIDGRIVDLFVAGYGLGKTSGSEMIAYGNQITRREIKTLSPQQSVQVSLSTGSSLPVMEQVVDGLEQRRLVWHWFLVGRRPTTNPYEVKVRETAAIVTGNANSERVVVLSTPDGPDARALLQAFVRDHESCVADGFVGARCRP
jgi:EpsI family protein